MIGIVAAMQEEADAFARWMQDTSSFTKAGVDFVTGKIGGNDVTLVASGLGKVNAALCTQILIDCYGADPVISFGVAGGIGEGLAFGELIVSTDAAAYGFEPDKGGLKPVDVPFMNGTVYSADQKLVADAVQAAEKLKLKYRKGRVLTDDRVLADSKLKAALRQHFNAECVEMEGAAVAQVCLEFGTPFTVIRTISDTADHNARVDFGKFIVEVANAYSRAIVEEIVRLSSCSNDFGTSRLRDFGTF